MPDTTWFCPVEDPETGWRCPAGTHDTYSARRHGCASPAAKEDRRLYMKRRLEGRAPKRREVNYVGLTRRIQAAALMGWDRRSMAAETGASTSTLWGLLEGRNAFTPVAVAQRLVRPLERLAMTPGPSRRAKLNAARRGFRPLLAWDDIDDPNEVPPPPVDLADQIAELAGRGLTQQEIAAKLDVSPKMVRNRWRATGRVEAEVDEHLLDVVLAGRRRITDCGLAEQDHVVARLWRDAIAEGYDRPGVRVAERLECDYEFVHRVHSRLSSRASRARREAS